jgi:hypothetical protein
MLCSAGANGSHQGQQPISVWRNYTQYLDRKKLARAVDFLTDRNNFNSFLSFRRYSQPIYSNHKLFPCVIDTIPSDKNTRGHTLSQDLDWLSCGERQQSLRLLTWHIRSCTLCPAGAKGMRSDQWQNKQRSHLFSRFRLVVLWWTMTKFFICLYDM